ncbi:hypothetical protein ACLKMY_41725, partial [Paraburkholderia mimosarum]|uniref:hypothetical protein n=1 Tax=Paraburkholderia mimosarum TaxID=312026 RepID=UPI0039C15D61
VQKSRLKTAYAITALAKWQELDKSCDALDKTVVQPFRVGCVQATAPQSPGPKRLRMHKLNAPANPGGALCIAGLTERGNRQRPIPPFVASGGAHWQALRWCSWRCGRPGHVFDKL